MKKFFLMAAMMVASFTAHAFDFDGINLNNNVNTITMEIAKKGYYYDEARGAMTGECRGTKIYLSMNYKDVNTDGKLGQLIVDIPMTEANAYAVVTKTFNVVYHLIGEVDGTQVYQADNDGTTVAVSSTKDGVRLVYNTPYYHKKK